MENVTKSAFIQGEKPSNRKGTAESHASEVRSRGRSLSHRLHGREKLPNVEDADYIVTMGCSIDQFRPDNWDGEARRWELEASAGETISSYRTVRDETRNRVQTFFDEIDVSD